MIYLFAVAFLLPLIFSLMFTPMVIKFANQIGATDTPGDRKVHSTVMPRIGGLSVFLSVTGAIIILYILYSGSLPKPFDGSYRVPVVIFCFISLFGLGFRDDLKPLTPEIKFGVQFVLAAMIYFSGFKISIITNPLGLGVLDIGIFDLPITVLWIVGITNAFNLIDGLDGLASGIAVIACISIFVITFLSGQIWTAVLSLVIAGALVGFLRYNFNPAKIFLGDCGSLFLGFALALLSIQSTAKVTTGFAVLLPMLVLAIPITDTLVAMVRRLISSFLKKNPEESYQSILHRLYKMFTPDKLHIHHRLLSLGLSHRNAVLVLYMVSMFFAFSTFLFMQIDTVQKSFAIAFTLGVVLLLFIKKLRYREMAIFHNGLMIPLYEKWILKRPEWSITFLDILFIIVAYLSSYTLIHKVNSAAVEQLNYWLALGLVTSIQFLTLWITGLYREKIDQFGIANTLKITKSTVFAVGITGIVFMLLEFLTPVVAVQFLIFDFYILLTLLFGYRIVYPALSFWFKREKEAGENVLIYGAGESGTLTLLNLLNSPNKDLRVIGFLDDNPELEGKLIYGYPVLGSHWTLPKTHRIHKIDSIFLCEKDICSENLRRIREIASQNGIKIKQLNITFQEFEGTDEKNDVKELKNFNYMPT